MDLVQHPRDRLIVALDLPSAEEARAVVARLGDSVTFYKIGYELGFAGGLALAEELRDAGKQLFLDFKLHDIGNTVAHGVKSLSRIGATFLTVHAFPQVLRAAVEARGDSGLKILGVTVLTSWDESDLRAAGHDMDVAALVAHRAAQVKASGADGLVCAASDLERVRAAGGSSLFYVTPGIRPAGGEVGDQKRVATPASALRAGATHLVVGRPIVQAADPRAAAEAIVVEMESADV